MFTYLFVPNNRQAFENKRVVDLALNSSIPGALLPVLENFRRRFFWPNWPPLGLWGCSQQCWMLDVVSVCTPCCMLLDVVACCWAKFETGQNFSPLQTEATFRATTPNIAGSCIVASVCTYSGLTRVLQTTAKECTKPVRHVQSCLFAN